MNNLKNTQDRLERHTRIRRLKRLMRPLPRRANIHRYPILKYFARTARSRAYLWSFRKRYVIRAIYVGTILSLLPIYGLQLLLAFVLSLVIRANLMVMAALQFITNPVTFALLYYLCFRVGDFFLAPFTDSHARFNLDQLKEISSTNPVEMFTQLLENTSGAIAYMFLSMTLGGLIIGYFTAFIISFSYQFIAHQMRQRYDSRQMKNSVQPSKNDTEPS